MNESERPTAVIARVDMSAPRHGTSAAHSSEGALFHAYRRAGDGIETQPCACGGYVHADPVAPGKGVAAHNHSVRHKAWRHWREAD